MLRGLSAAALVMILGACSSFPPYDAPIDHQGYPTVNQVVDKIQCEIAEARDSPTINSSNAKRRLEEKGVEPFDDWVAAVTLTLTVINTEGLSPSSGGVALAFIDPLKLASNSFGFGGSIILNQQRTRTFTENYTLEIEHIPPNETCDNIGKRWHNFNLEGDLGLKENIHAALHSFDRSDAADTYGPESAGTEGAFSATLEFDISKGLTVAGPTWTLTQFKASGGIGYQREDLHKLVITFVPKNCPVPDKPPLKCPDVVPSTQVALGVPTVPGYRHPSAVAQGPSAQSTLDARSRASIENENVALRQAIGSIAASINKP